MKAVLKVNLNYEVQADFWAAPVLSRVLEQPEESLILAILRAVYGMPVLHGKKEAAAIQPAEYFPLTLLITS
jgi:hypothetical protein